MLNPVSELFNTKLHQIYSKQNPVETKQNIESTRVKLAFFFSAIAICTTISHYFK